jgi:hypothetical protein
MINAVSGPDHFIPVKFTSFSLDMRLYELQWMSESCGDKISISAESRNPIYWSHRPFIIKLAEVTWP